MENFLFIAQIVLSVGLVGAVLLQVRGGGLGGIFGQADTVYRTKRGAEKILFQLTIAMVILFAVVSILTLRIS